MQSVSSEDSSHYSQAASIGRRARVLSRTESRRKWRGRSLLNANRLFIYRERMLESRPVRFSAASWYSPEVRCVSFITNARIKTMTPLKHEARSRVLSRALP